MKADPKTAAFTEELEKVMDEEVRPILKEHGGDLKITAWKDGVLNFRLQGNCCGCPSAWLTAEEIVKAPLMERFPELKDVVVDNDLDDELIQLAKDVLSKKRTP